jgi:uncharacterized membrane protein
MRRRWLARFAGDERGTMAIMFAVAIMLGMVFSAFAIDEMALYHERRVAQSGVDLAAIAAASDPTNAFSVARGVLVEAGIISPTTADADLVKPANATRLKVEAGQYAANAGLASTARFEVGKAPYNAVRVSLIEKGTLYFAKGWSDEPNIGVTGTATVTPLVAFSVGSRLAQLKVGIGNTVLNALLGSSVTLSAASYDGLASANVDLFPFLDALAQQLNIHAGTYADLITASADHGVIAKALASVLTGSPKTAATTIANAVGHNGKVKLSRLFALGQLGELTLGSGPSGMLTGISALELLSVSAALSDGTHQVALNLAAGVPSLTSLTAVLAVGEPPQGASWYGIGPSGAIVRTAQVRLKLVATIGGGLLLLNAQVHVPLYLEIAYAEAGVKSASCPASGAKSGAAVIDTRPGVARLVLGETGSIGNFASAPVITKAKLIDLILLKVSAKAEADMGAVSAVPLSFSASEIAAGTIKTAKTTTFTQSLAQRLIASLVLDFDVLGFGLSPKALLDTTIRALLLPLTPVLDTVINDVLDTLGLSLGEADVHVYGVTCHHPVLVG